MKIKPGNISRRTAALFAAAVLGFLCWFVPVASAQSADVMDLTARKAFAEMNITPLELLGKSTRLDMLDYFDADSLYRAKNALEGQSVLEKVTPEYLKVSITDVSTLEIRLLPSNKGTIVMTVYTVGAGGQAPDSQIDFYDASFRQLPAWKYFKPLTLQDYVSIPKGSLTSMRELREMVPFPTFELKASPDNTDLTGSLTVGKYMDIDNYNILRLFIIPQVTYRWTGTKYEKMKR